MRPSRLLKKVQPWEKSGRIALLHPVLEKSPFGNCHGGPATDVNRADVIEGQHRFVENNSVEFNSIPRSALGLSAPK